ncbi:hypothetical protein TSUD_409020 [Trifolium subterraneum]|uniref:DUF4219 domain-containing protein n=1 Tax=Trifolium subterraneum TaxID=3900 RepID=A0A2Z6P6H9_TRISU|nr:hypothetical protein TSUD_409020 [Trifolium subterraneum]
MAKNAKFISEDGENYYYWKDKMELFLRSQDNNMEEYDRIMECKTAKEIWETLQTHHEGTNSVKETRIDIGVRKFELFEMKEEETIDQMYGRFTSIINELNSLGKAYTTHERIRKILRCLPKTWRPIVTAITVAKDLTKVSLEDLIGSLKAHESVLQEDKPKKKMIALETQSGECSQKDETLCENEESLQEDDEEEIAFLSRRIQRLMTRRNQLKKNFQPKRNGAKPEKKSFFKKKSMMATWDDLEEAQSEDEEQETNVCLMTHSNAEEVTLDPCSSCQKTEHLFDNLLYDTQFLNQKNAKLRDEITVLTKERDEYKKESSLKSEVIKGMQTAHTELSKSSKDKGKAVVVDNTPVGVTQDLMTKFTSTVVNLDDDSIENYTMLNRDEIDLSDKRPKQISSKQKKVAKINEDSSSLTSITTKGPGLDLILEDVGSVEYEKCVITPKQVSVNESKGSKSKKVVKRVSPHHEDEDDNAPIKLLKKAIKIEKI